MTRWIVQLFNGSLLLLLLIGVPIATSTQIGHLRVSSASSLELVTLSGVLLVSSLNLIAAFFGPRALRPLLLSWTVLFALVGVVEFLAFNHYLDFSWLKRFLLWLKHRRS